MTNTEKPTESGKVLLLSGPNLNLLGEKSFESFCNIIDVRFIDLMMNANKKSIS